MTRSGIRLGRLPLVAVPLLAVLLATAGCGAGGFGRSTQPEPTTSISNYVALGDGFAAGPDLGKVTDASCLRTADNYPVQVAKLVGANAITDVSCTGADSRSLTNSFKSPATKRTLPAQLDAIKADTDLVTIGIGLGDRGLLSTMFRLCAALPCPPGAISPKPLVSQLALFGENLTSAVRTIQDKAPNAYIVLVGYPSLIPATDGCAALPRATSPQLVLARTVLDTVNDNIRAAAQQTGSGYVDAAALTSSHTPCDDEPWVNGYQPKGKAKPFHPLAPEQHAVAEAIAAQVRSR